MKLNEINLISDEIKVIQKEINILGKMEINIF